MVLHRVHVTVEKRTATAHDPIDTEGVGCPCEEGVASNDMIRGVRGSGGGVGSEKTLRQRRHQHLGILLEVKEELRRHDVYQGDHCTHKDRERMNAVSETRNTLQNVP